jgi:phosphoserine phosphatase
MAKFKLAIFDMDGTLIEGRTIFIFAEKMGFKDELIKLIHNQDKEFYEKSIDIAKLSKGLKYDELIKIFRNIPLQKNVELLINELKKRNIKIAIVTDSYQFVADDLKLRLGFDYAYANNLIIEKGIVTGELKIHNKDLSENFFGDKIYSICKSCVLDHLCEKLKISKEETIVIGDGEIDIGMIKKAGLGIAYKAPELVQKHADIITNDMKTVIDYI